MEVDQKSLVDLPTEILVDIFDYLDGKSLKAMREVSKRFNEV